MVGIDSISTTGRLTVGVLTLKPPTHVATWYRAVIAQDTLLAAALR